MATHSSVLAWRIPGTGEPGGLPSMGSHRVGHDRSDLAAAAAMLPTGFVSCIGVSPDAEREHCFSNQKYRVKNGINKTLMDSDELFSQCVLSSD